MLSFVRDLISLPFHALAALRAATSFPSWDICELPDDDEFYTPWHS